MLSVAVERGWCKEDLVEFARWPRQGDHDETPGVPREAMSVDVGNGTIIRYDEGSSEVVGMTFVGLGERFVRRLKEVA